MPEVKKDRPREVRGDPTTAHYVDRMEREGRPITLRIDERPPLVFEDARAYQMLWELVDRIETIEAVREGLKQIEESRTISLDEVDRRLRRKHGLQG